MNYTRLPVRGSPTSYKGWSCRECWVSMFGYTMKLFNRLTRHQKCLYILCVHYSRVRCYWLSHTHTHTHARTRTHTRSHSHIHSHTHINTHIYTHIHILTHTHTHNTHTHTRIYAYTYTLTHMQLRISIGRDGVVVILLIRTVWRYKFWISNRIRILGPGFLLCLQAKFRTVKSTLKYEVHFLLLLF